jgi:hypothetical protein
MADLKVSFTLGDRDLKHFRRVMAKAIDVANPEKEREITAAAVELIKRAREAALPLVSAVPGFKAYYMVLGDDDALTTVSVFEDKAAADACNAKLLDWIKQNMGPYAAAPTQAAAGRVVIHKA